MGSGGYRRKRPCPSKKPAFLAEVLTASIPTRARSVVQVHPGPPFKSPINTRRFSLFPFRGISLKKPICQLFANFTIGRTALHSGRYDRSGEGQTASIDSAMSRTLPSQVEGRARQCKTLQGCGTSGKSFLVSLRGRSSVG